MQLFRHAFMQLIGNFGAALKIAGLLLVAQWAFIAFIGPGVATNLVLVEGAMFRWGQHNPWAIVVFLPMIIYSVMTVISWHRHVLLNEPAPLFDAKLFKGVFWSYLWSATLSVILVIIATFVILFLVAFPIGFIAVIWSPLPLIVAIALTLLSSAIAVWIGLRLTASLPGRAAGRQVSIFDGLAETRKLDWQIIGCSLCMVGLSFVMNWVLLGVVLPASVTLFPYASAAVSWFTIMLSVSVLTTIYGHACEGLPLNPPRRAGPDPTHG